MIRYPGLLLMLMFPLHAIAGQQSPEAAVKAFYQWEIHGRSGLRLDTFPRTRHLFTPELYDLIVAIMRYEDACTALVPEDIKPFILDGDPWYYHSQDGANELEQARVRSKQGDRAEVEARLAYDASYKWTDTVIVRRIDGTWRIADIRFEQGGGLIEGLRDFAAARCGKTLPGESAHGR